MLKCDICETEGHYKLRCENSLWFCNECMRKRYVPKEDFNPGLHVKVNLSTMQNVSKARLDEVDRRVILPYTIPGKDYLVGRRNNDGSISEKMADLTP